MPSSESPSLSRATLKDVAREAGVGLATVDRVLNKRPRVHARTVSRVEDAIQRLNYRPNSAAVHLARQSQHRLCFVLPSASNSFVALLREQVTDHRIWLQDRGAVARIVEADVFDPASLASTLLALVGECDTAVVMTLDHPLVRAAIGDLVAHGICVITLVSDVPHSRRQHFVGIDNVAAGRTAATLLGRFLGGRSGTVARIAGSLSLRDHAERLLGFNQVMQAEYPRLKLAAPLEGQDDPARNAVLVRELLATQADLLAIYSMGAGNEGISAALQEASRSRRVLYVGHELTPASRRDLLAGTMDAVINQDAAHEIRSALRLALARITKEPVRSDQERIRIDIYLRDNLPS